MPHLFDVLPLYMVLVSIGPFIIVGLSKWPRATLLASAALYAGAQFGLGFPMRHYGFQAFYFNPFAWQLVFTAGIWLARVKPEIGRNIPVMVAGVTLILAVALRVWVIPYSVRMGYLADSPAWRVDPSCGDRTNLHFVRILYFAVLTYVVMGFLPKGDRFWNLTPIRGICLIGRHTLSGFCVGIWFAWVSDPLLVHLHGEWFHAMAAFVVGVALTAAVAFFAESRRRAMRLSSAAVASV